MTAPTQPPDPRVQRIADALDVWSDTVGYESHRRLARVLVEELGGRERETVQYQYLGEPAERPTDGITLQNGEVITWRDKQWHLWDAGYTRTAWYLSDLIQCVTFCCSDNDLRALLALQQRENAETIKALKERVETAEAANTELDNARKSAEQSARNLRENNATLRAELDAIKGAQVPYRWTVVSEDRLSFTFTSVESAQTWAKNEGGEVIPLFTHPAPALPVVGACVVKPNGDMFSFGHWPQERNEKNAIGYARECGGVAYRTYRDVTPLPTEGGR